MRAILLAFETSSRATALVLGAVVLGLAGIVMETSWTATDIADWAQRVFGTTFMVATAGLVFISVFSWLKLHQTGGSKVWLEAGLQASTGIATIALTYTLLGISLGVGSLATKELTPETVRFVIRELTENFSMAFMTTVVGLPVSAILRTVLLVTNAHQQSRSRALTVCVERD